MTAWAWIAVGIGSFLALSLLVAVGLAFVLSEIGRGVSELHESEGWTTAPPKRALAEADRKAAKAKANQKRVVRLR